MAPLPSFLAAFKELIDNNREKWLEDYYTFLRFPSVSSEPEYKEGMRACANWIIELLKGLDFRVELLETSGHPVIFAHYEVDIQKPTLLIYNHYDVQPVDPLNEWESNPFEPALKGSEVYARGAQDNKGQCFYVLQALKFYLMQRNFPLNIKLCIEGEEETGSAGLSMLLEREKERFRADYIAIIDLGLRAPQVPAITLGTRGIITMDLEVHGSHTDLHSGSHGGIALNPIHVLVEMLASLRNAEGRITIPGFYDQVQEMQAEERSSVSFQFDVAEYQRLTGAYPFGGEKDRSALERAWVRPTLEINGISGGYSGKGFKTVIPAKAFAKISCRLVPRQVPEQIGELIKKHLKEIAPQGVQVNVNVHPGQGRAVRVNLNSKIVKCVSIALQDVFGVPCEYIFTGASIPIIPELAAAAGGEVILMGLGLATDQIHAPNEHFGVDRLEKGMLVIMRTLDLLE
ncbi:MAG: dipeptidase [Candidatus Protochlamydia sp.]|nr:dipeptidase [Candidatus Protochlamydia sp.]